MAPTVFLPISVIALIAVAVFQCDPTSVLILQFIQGSVSIAFTA